MNFEFKPSALTDSGKPFFLMLVGLLVPSVPKHMSKSSLFFSLRLSFSVLLLFCLRNDISAAETYRMLQKAYVTKNVYKWYRDFKEGRAMICNWSVTILRHVDLQRSERPSTSIDDINKIKEMVLGNSLLTIRELVDIVGISFGSVQTILKDHLGLRRVKSRRTRQSRSKIKVMLIVFFDYIIPSN